MIRNRNLFETKCDFLFSVSILFLFLLNPAKDALIIISAALIHESGHIIAMLLFKRKIKSIRFSVFGITMETESSFSSYMSDALVSFSGAFFNLAAMGISVIIIRNSPNYHIMLFFLANFLFFVINILPIKKLDGGEILYSVLCNFIEIDSAERISDAVSLFFSVMLFIAGICFLIITKGNFSLLIIAVSLLIEKI